MSLSTNTVAAFYNEDKKKVFHPHIILSDAFLPNTCAFV